MLLQLCNLHYWRYSSAAHSTSSHSKSMSKLRPSKSRAAQVPQSAAPERHFGSSTGHSSRPMQFENCHQMPVMQHDAMKSHEITILNWSRFLRIPLVSHWCHIGVTTVTTMSRLCCIISCDKLRQYATMIDGSWRLCKFADPPRWIGGHKLHGRQRPSALNVAGEGPDRNHLRGPPRPCGHRLGYMDLYGTIESHWVQPLGARKCVFFFVGIVAEQALCLSKPRVVEWEGQLSPSHAFDMIAYADHMLILPHHTSLCKK